MTSADLIHALNRSPARDAAEVIGEHMQAMAPQPSIVEGDEPGTTKTVAPPEPTAEGVVPSFIAKTLCFALPLLRKFVKVSGQVDDAINIIVAFVCSQT